MNDLTREWVEKAEADLDTATREAAVAGRPNLDAVGFHAQQCAEKYVKGVLQEAGIAFPRTHDLVRLVDLAAPVAPDLLQFRPELPFLTAFAVEGRYPGFAVDEEDARDALRIAAEARRISRAFLGLD